VNEQWCSARFPGFNERNGRDGIGKKEREEAKKRKISERILDRINRDSHNEQTQQQVPWNDHEKT
jgi:hypothetical protein